ncbi:MULTISPECIES: hypothetical protein [unclassified Coleofasciculus]|nr:MULTISPECIES: hypothetical protein [unclassified Coleofasciculus]
MVTIACPGVVANAHLPPLAYLLTGQIALHHYLEPNRVNGSCN